MICLIFTGFGYGHPNGMHPMMMNAGWPDAAYLTFANSEFLRQQAQNPQFAKSKFNSIFKDIE